MVLCTPMPVGFSINSQVRLEATAQPEPLSAPSPLLRAVQPTPPERMMGMITPVHVAPPLGVGALPRGSPCRRQRW